jgi:hypothetical protein
MWDPAGNNVHLNRLGVETCALCLRSVQKAQMKRPGRERFTLLQSWRRVRRASSAAYN